MHRERCNCRHRAHGVTVGTVVVIPVEIARIEVQVMSVIAAIRRSGPAVTVRTTIVQLTITVIAVAGRRKKWSVPLIVILSGDGAE